MFWRRKRDPIETCADALYAAVKGAVTQDGRIRVEELISASGAILGEAAIARVGEFHPREHNSPPGQGVFSDRMNGLLCGEKNLDQAPAESIFGDLRNRLVACGFSVSDLPNLKEVFAHFAGNIGKKEEWGRVPLSIPKDNYPFARPLFAAYQLRAIVDKSLVSLGADSTMRLRAITAVLARALCETRATLAPNIAASLAFETVNGMAKTAPMTDAAIARANQAAGQQREPGS
jgi:hypothetical protein